MSCQGAYDDQADMELPMTFSEIAAPGRSGFHHSVGNSEAYATGLGTQSLREGAR